MAFFLFVFFCPFPSSFPNPINDFFLLPNKAKEKKMKIKNSIYYCIIINNYTTSMYDSEKLKEKKKGKSRKLRERLINLVIKRLIKVVNKVCQQRI